MTSSFGAGGAVKAATGTVRIARLGLFTAFSESRRTAASAAAALDLVMGISGNAALNFFLEGVADDF